MFDVGDVIDGKYTVIVELGNGGMGRVLKVKGPKGVIRALKYCTRRGPDSRRRFKREVRIMARIEHKNVVRVVDSDLDHDPPYFLMPLAKGSLIEELAVLSKDEDAALDAFEAICLGVQAIHSSSAVHRDLKPHNALRLKDGRIVVCDLGLARLTVRDSTPITRKGFMGTGAYAAPEQHLPNGMRDADERTDIYQLGKTLYQLLTGLTPAMIDPKLISAGLAHIVQKATKQTPAHRYQHVGLLIDAIGMYRQAKDPKKNPREALEHLIQQLVDDLRKDEYDSDVVQKFLQTLAERTLSRQSVIEAFERIPTKLLSVFAKDFSDELEPALQAYSDAIEANIGEFNFAYAETVAKKMERLFLKSESADIRVLALQTALTAAVRLHRFAAMTIFNSMLQKVRTEDAMPAAEMLKEKEHYYKVVAEQVSPDRLNSTIRQVRKSLVPQSEDDDD